MAPVPMKLVTVVAEAVLESRLVDDVKRLGASGYTLGQVRGEGSRGIRATDWEGYSLRLEVIAPEALAQRILQHVADEYFRHYAVIAWLSDVQVFRAEKYEPRDG